MSISSVSKNKTPRHFYFVRSDGQEHPTANRRLQISSSPHPLPPTPTVIPGEQTVNGPSFSSSPEPTRRKGPGKPSPATPGRDGGAGIGMRRERRWLPRPARCARRAGLGNGPRRRGRRLRRLLLALPVQLREAVLCDPPPGWMDSSLSTGFGRFLGDGFCRNCFLFRWLHGERSWCCFCGLYFCVECFISSKLLG